MAQQAPRLFLRWGLIQRGLGAGQVQPTVLVSCSGRAFGSSAAVAAAADAVEAVEDAVQLPGVSQKDFEVAKGG
jgi:hypothetical protein